MNKAVGVQAACALTVFVACESALAQEFPGACDGSAIVSLDNGYFLNASDEDNLITLYRHDSPGKGVAPPFPLSPFLETEENKKGRPKEADIEAAARFGSRVYWIGSFGRDSNGNEEVSRARFFATDVTDRGDATQIKPVGKYFSGLLAPLRSLDERVGKALGAASALAPEKGGISIEGLAAMDDGTLLIGFRSPIIDGSALVVRMLNPDEIIAGKPPRFAPPVLLDLGGLGIRSLERGAGADSFWVLAGPVGKGEPFRLYEWRFGNAKPALSNLALPTGLGSPEGLMIDRASKRLFIATDGGDAGTPPCKQRAFPERAFAVRELND